MWTDVITDGNLPNQHTCEGENDLPFGDVLIRVRDPHRLNVVNRNWVRSRVGVRDDGFQTGSSVGRIQRRKEYKSDQENVLPET